MMAFTGWFESRKGIITRIGSLVVEVYNEDSFGSMAFRFRSESTCFAEDTLLMKRFVYVWDSGLGLDSIWWRGGKTFY
jgi:hypothetical protein